MAITAKPVLVLFGGVSAEHEISIITGLQALERIDTSVYTPHVVYVTKKGAMCYLPGLASRKGFLTAAQKQVSFGKDEQGGYMEVEGAFGKKIYPYAAYFAFHGGTGEGGAYAGLMETCGIPFTAAGQEGSIIAMNKWLTKEALRDSGIRVVEGMRFFDSFMRERAGEHAKSAVAKLGLPLIVKPAHLGSSIGIEVARTDVELEKALLTAAFTDSEVVVEKYLEGFTEYNCAVRLVNGVVETSPIERPIAKDEILSFADKYERGSKKTGTGMASLSRELPANIPAELKSEVEAAAKTAFIACRMKGMARIDFMHHEGTLYLTEINTIPGSMSFYLWEAAGETFETQIATLIEQAVRDRDAANARVLDYSTDVVKKFVSGN